MSVSFDKAARDRARSPGEDRPAPAIAPGPKVESEAMNLRFEIHPATNPTPEKERTARLMDPGFGRIFTDHMAVVRYRQAKGWHDARVESRANFPLDPATAVLHYAQEIFEGLKAYKRADGGVNLFRPDANARRFRNSAERMAMAPLPEPLFIEAVEQLLEDPSERLLGDAQDIEQVGDLQARIAMDEMHHPVMGAAEAKGFQFMVGIADKVAVGEEQQFNDIPAQIGLARGRPPRLRGSRISAGCSP